MAIRRIGCRVVNWTEPEYPQALLQIYDPPVLIYEKVLERGTIMSEFPTGSHPAPGTFR